MTFNDLLFDSFLNIPRNWCELGYDTYLECVTAEGQAYIHLIEKVEDFNFGNDEFLGDMSKTNLLQTVKSFYKVIIDVLNIYLKDGSPHKAYMLFDDQFKIVDSNINNPRQLVYFLEFCSLYPEYYRLRNEKCIEINEMFHVPFEKRHKIHSFRYSIPGYPTLYLSNSIYLAYQEMGSPEFDNLYACKIIHRTHNDRESLLDMTNRPLFPETFYQFKYLSRWLLIMACSSKVGFPDDPFKPEYILSQITFQWVKNNMSTGGKKILGICYPSSRINTSLAGYKGFFHNVAIPIKMSAQKGYCEILKAIFCLTRPISFEGALTHDIQTLQQGQVISINENGSSIEYINTVYGKIEYLLSQKPFSNTFTVDEKVLR